MRPFSYRHERLEAFAEYIESERAAYPDENNNRAAFALESIFRRYRYAYRLRQIADPLIAQYQSPPSYANTERATQQLSPEEMQELADRMHLGNEIQMHFESFFLHTSVLCDELAHLLLFFFGDARGIKMSGHRMLSRNIDEYLKTKSLSFDQSLREDAELLERELCDFRDKQIVHDFNPRKIRALSWSLETGTVSLAYSGFLHPKDSDQPVFSKGWDDLIAVMDRHVWRVLGIVKNNREHSRLSVA
jgi:hypothetical protein